MPDIVLTTLNAKYIHASFGLRYLMANLGPLQPSACIAEFDINQRSLDIAEILLARSPKIIGFGVYIWNVAQTAEVIAAIKRVQPDITIILGGPEVSYEWETQPIVPLADHVITGEADLKFAEVCRTLLGVDGSAKAALPKIIPSPLPEFSQLKPPYDLYTKDDIAHRIIYVEASRGCPFTCEFCLSSLDIPVRQVPLPVLLGEMQRLLDRGVKQFKFVDRTFNLNVNTSKAILEFFLSRHQPDRFYHFEMVPDRLPEALREVIAKFPRGSLQFEVGVQTFNETVGGLIKRRQNYDRLEENFRFLRNETGVHIHADLIVGLPGETLESFATGFDRLVALGPHEIQVGILKRLRGTPIARHDAEWEMVYHPNPTYEILRNKLIDFATMQRLRRFAKYWDLIGNSGNFVETTPLIWSTGDVIATVGQNALCPRTCAAVSLSPHEGRVGREPERGEFQKSSTPPLPAPLLQLRSEERETLSAHQFQSQPGNGGSPFQRFLGLSDWLYARTKRTDSINLVRLMELLFEFLTGELKLDAHTAAQTIWRDYQRGGRYDKPGFLKDFLVDELPQRNARAALPKRQARHMA